ncbi:MAG: hypothetical protein OXF51_08215 [Alphaproteobacteria bacterium]|nr:hypothetical protein [Alphaproteobacteria bacterium]
MATGRTTNIEQSETPPSIAVLTLIPSSQNRRTREKPSRFKPNNAGNPRQSSSKDNKRHRKREDLLRATEEALHRIAAEARLDGIYVIRTSLGAEAMGTEAAVDAYKSLAGVERAFRNAKTDPPIRRVRF